MATELKNLSVFEGDAIPSANDMKVGIVVAEWNWEITGALLNGAVETLKKYGCAESNIMVRKVPGTFELTLGAQFFAEYTDVDAVITIGCVIQGDTRHFDFICNGVTYGITELALKCNMPVIFSVLTTNDLQQALDRAGGKHGNKGDEAAMTAIKMIALQKEMSGESNISYYE
ncbi:MAG: 6,7-dimethyl-8-ribityllumazine synthase [Rikenellaceae bacterium]|nr:6,7-dimethyl-8-ribityllumazine synthase [Rikenellaceae bacterium]